MRPTRILSALFALTLGACSVLTPAPEARSTADGDDTPSARAGGDPAITDANVAAIVIAANNADIAYADQALAKSRDPGIRRFAQMTKTDHETMNGVAGRLATKLKLVPMDNELSFDLRDDSETKRGMLREFEGFAFDSAYIANEVAYHRDVLKALDDALIPSAKNAELKALLVQVRPAVAAHLDHAVSLAATKASRR